MESGLPILNPTKTAPFEGDLLGRTGCAHVLRQIVDAFGDGCVIGLNGKWGSGKTTFLRMWEEYMERFEQYKIVHFNSWENDDVSDPLIALMAEFKKLAKGDDSKWEKFSKSCGKVTLAMLPTLLGMLAKHYTGIDIEKLAEKGADAVVEIINENIEQYTQQKAAITAFRKELRKYIETITPHHPLIFVIDELDRCNPKFAVKLLERVKHLFEVEGVVYIISIDETQLCNSIRGYYGSEQFDARDYLRRFLRFTYDLPQAGADKLISAAMARFGYDELREQTGRKKKSYEDLPNFITFLYQGQGMSIRQLEQYLLYIRLALDNLAGCELEGPSVALLVYLKMFEPECFKHFVSYEWDETAFIQYIEEHFGDEFFDVAYPVVMYNFNQAIAEIMLIRWAEDSWETKVCDKQGNLKFKVTKFSDEHFSRCFQNPFRTPPALNTVLQSLNLENRINIQ